MSQIRWKLIWGSKLQFAIYFTESIIYFTKLSADFTKVSSNNEMWMILLVKVNLDDQIGFYLIIIIMSLSILFQRMFRRAIFVDSRSRNCVPSLGILTCMQFSYQFLSWLMSWLLKILLKQLLMCPSFFVGKKSLQNDLHERLILFLLENCPQWCGIP